MKNPKKILIIIQRSNGDVLLSSSLIRELFENFDSPIIDILVNDDTISVAKILPNINKIYTFSYKEKNSNRWSQEVTIVKYLYRKYDLSINLTASDRSVAYALLASKNSISAIEADGYKSWWKKILLTNYYIFDSSVHILINNLKPLSFLNINSRKIFFEPKISKKAFASIKQRLNKIGVNSFLVFHPSAQYKYKIYPKKLRDILLKELSSLGILIIVTGSNNKIDLEIKKQLPSLPNIVDFIGETTLEEYFALCKLSSAYIGMDTLNMHIAAAQNKRIFAIYGPTNLRMWSPWSNVLELSAVKDMPIQSYGNITIFQANMACVACGRAGCEDSGESQCLNNIDPKSIFNEIKNWHKNVKL